MNWIRHKLLFGAILFASCQTLSAEVRSPLNGQILPDQNQRKAYSFAAIGHAYGAPGNAHSIYPASSLLSNIELINRLDLSFFLLLGDIVRHPSTEQTDAFKRGFASKIEAPIFNAVGNHDVADRLRYEMAFPGRTFFKFNYSGDLFIVLDTEQAAGEISGAQLAFLNETLKGVIDGGEAKNIFIFSHKLIWAASDPVFWLAYRHSNGWGYVSDNRSPQRVTPLLNGVANKSSVFWLSGDIGVFGSYPLFYYKYSNLDLSYIATGIGDTAEDAFLQVIVDAKGNVVFEPISLTGKDLKPLSTYDIGYLERRFATKNVRRIFAELVSKCLRLISLRYFWYGFAAACACVALLFLVVRRGFLNHDASPRGAGLPPFNALR